MDAVFRSTGRVQNGPQFLGEAFEVERFLDKSIASLVPYKRESDGQMSISGRPVQVKAGIFP